MVTSGRILIYILYTAALSMQVNVRTVILGTSKTAVLGEAAIIIIVLGD